MYSNLAHKIFFGFYFASDQITNEKLTDFSHQLVGPFLYLFCPPICISLNTDLRFGFMIQMQSVDRHQLEINRTAHFFLFSSILPFLFNCFGGHCNYSRIVCIMHDSKIREFLHKFPFIRPDKIRINNQ